MIDLTEGPSGPPDVPMASSPEPQMVTAPSTPINTQAIHPPPSGSFTVDESLANPWKSGRTFNF